jgi:hypothetical protein
MELPKRPSGEDMMEAVRHWITEAAASFFAEGNFKKVDSLVHLVGQIDLNFPRTVPPSPFDLTSEEMSLAMGNSFINAIKMVRNRTGLGLKEAKEFVEEFRRVSGDPSVAGCHTMWFGMVGSDGKVKLEMLGKLTPGETSIHYA